MPREGRTLAPVNRAQAAAWSRMTARLRDVWGWALRLAPGVALLAAVAGAARALAPYAPGTISEVFIAIVLGLLIFNTLGTPQAVAPGARFGLRVLLRLGIVLLGARLSFGAVLGVGVQSLAFVILAFSVGFGTALFAAWRFGLTRPLAVLLAVGTAICGNSAIIAASPIIKARRQEVAYAVATITLFGTLAVLVYPFLGRLLAVDQAAFGAWAGTAVNDTSQVVATGYAYGQEAGEVATIVKLTRNLLIGPVLIGLGIWAAAAGHAEQERGLRARFQVVRKAVPLFVLGFLGMAVLNTAGLFSADVLSFFKTVGSFLISMAIAAIGLTTDVRSLWSAGLRPLATGLTAALVLAAFSLSAVLLFWH